MTFLYDGRCYTVCPDRSYMVAEKSPSQSTIHTSVPQKRCEACHYSCVECSGPHDYDCTRCMSEAQFRRTEFNQSFCVPVPFDEITNGVAIEQSTNNFTTQNLRDRNNLIFFLIYIVFIISVTLASTFFIVRFIVTQYCTAPKGKDQKDYAYNRIAYDGTNEQEHVVIERDMLDESNVSDSEEVEANN